MIMTNWSTSPSICYWRIGIFLGLVALLMLNLFWSVLIARMIVNMVAGNGLKDVRSDDEDGECVSGNEGGKKPSGACAGDIAPSLPTMLDRVPPNLSLPQ